MNLKKLSWFIFPLLILITLLNNPTLFGKSKKLDVNSDASFDDKEVPDKKFPAEIKHCHDGDTCRILAENGAWFNARLAGIDAPEVSRYGKKKSSGQPLGEESRDTLTKLVVKKPGVSIRQVDLDHFNRSVVEIYVNDECINLKLLELGMAERYQGKTKRIDKAKYDEAESKGQIAKAGIWGLKDYISPKLWRKDDKE